MEKFNDRNYDNIIRISPKNFVDIVYQSSDFLIVREVPFLGRRFKLAKLIYNNELCKQNKLKDGGNTEYSDLLNDKSISRDYINVLNCRNRSLETKIGIKFQLPFCKHYRILKEGKIKRKDYEIVNHENLKIMFTTSYSYHLIDPLKFLKMYMNRKNLRPNDNVWDVIQDDISVILGKSLIEHFTECDYLILNKDYVSNRFEKVLLPAKAEILYNYGLYIDDIYIENFKLPDKIIDSSATISAEAMRKKAQLGVAHLEGQIKAIEIDAEAQAKRQKLLDDIESLGGVGNYQRIMQAQNLTTSINFGGSNEIISKNSQISNDENIYNPQKNQLTEKMINDLFDRAICNTEGILSKYAQEYLVYSIGKKFKNVYDISQSNYRLLIEHYDYLDRLDENEAVDKMNEISYKLSVRK